MLETTTKEVHCRVTIATGCMGVKSLVCSLFGFGISSCLFAVLGLSPPDRLDFQPRRKFTFGSPHNQYGMLDSHMYSIYAAYLLAL